MNAPANGQAARRLESFKRLLGHIHELLSLDFGFVLWDGSTVPADHPSNALVIVFADEGVVAAMLRRPWDWCYRRGGAKSSAPQNELQNNQETDSTGPLRLRTPEIE